MKKIVFVLMGLLMLAGCKVQADSFVPYNISGEMVLGETEGNENAGFKFSFINRSEKKVKAFTMVFYLFDDFGEPVLTGRNNIVYRIEAEVNPNEKFEYCASLDKYLVSIPEEPFDVDFLYVSMIEYEDSTKWMDPFGMKFL